MRLLRATVAASFTVSTVTTGAMAPAEACVTIPTPEPGTDSPETITVNVEQVGDHLVLYPDRSYLHRALMKALGV